MVIYVFGHKYFEYDVIFHVAGCHCNRIPRKLHFLGWFCPFFFQFHFLSNVTDCTKSDNIHVNLLIMKLALRFCQMVGAYVLKTHAGISRVPLDVTTHTIDFKLWNFMQIGTFRNISIFTSHFNRTWLLIRHIIVPICA